MSMNKTPGFYIFQNKWRLFRGTLRHHWTALTDLLIAVIFIAEEFYRNAEFLTAGVPISDCKYVIYSEAPSALAS